MEVKVISPIKQPIKVEKEVPLPVKRTHYSMLPFHEMEVGDSFFITKSRFQHTSLIQLRGFLYLKANKYRLETGALDRHIFAIDRDKNGCRCWRIE